MNKKGFTLIEMMIAMFISTIVIFAIVSTYITGITLMRRSGRHIRAQQEAINTMNQIGNYVRESLGTEVYNFTPPNHWSSSLDGNFIVIYNPHGETSAFYHINNNMYYASDFSRDNFNQSSNIRLAKDIRETTSFSKKIGSIYLDFEIRDDDDTNITLFTSTTWFTPRN